MNPCGNEVQDPAIIRVAAHLPDLIVYGDFAKARPCVNYFDGVLMFVDISGKRGRPSPAGSGRLAPESSRRAGLPVGAPRPSCGGGHRTEELWSSPLRVSQEELRDPTVAHGGLLGRAQSPRGPLGARSVHSPSSQGNGALVAGFTAMTEKFSTAMYMDRGAEQLVEILNRYLSDIVEKVLVFGGDILKFAGLAAGHITMLIFGDEARNHFVVTGQVVEDVRFAENVAKMNEVILSPNCWQLCDRRMIEIERFKEHRAAKVALLKLPSGFNFDDFFNKCMTFMNYYPSGQRKLPSVTTETGLPRIPFPSRPARASSEVIRVVASAVLGALTYPLSSEHAPPCSLGLPALRRVRSPPGPPPADILRLACLLRSDPTLELSLQSYLMESISRQIRDKQLRGYLSELRPVTTVFVNLKFKERKKADIIGLAIQDACAHISSVLKVFRGQINKVFMFDKVNTGRFTLVAQRSGEGCSFLCVFGFPGEKVPDEPTNALQSAMNIFDLCSHTENIQTVSIGVTSGIVFCGIVGHTMRHEYTVIGQKVNTAARMMMHYPGVVSCDTVTYSGSNLPAYFFKELPKKAMKGVGDCGPIYQCLGLNEKVVFGMAYLIHNRNESYPLLVLLEKFRFAFTFESMISLEVMSDQSRSDVYDFGDSKLLQTMEEKPRGSLLRGLPSCQPAGGAGGADDGRDRELRYFRNGMKEFLTYNHSRVLMYEGRYGYGKSELLMEIEYLAQGEDHRTIAIALTKVSLEQKFYTVQILMASVLGLDTCRHYRERQTRLQNKLRALLDGKFFCLLNDIFHVQFPFSREVSKMSTLMKQEQLELLFMNILEQAAKPCSFHLGLSRGPPPPPCCPSSGARLLDCSRGFPDKPCAWSTLQTVIEERIILIVDEAQFVDSASWVFMERVIRTLPIFIIMSLSPFEHAPCAAARAVIENRHTTYIALGTIQPKDIRSKACLDLSVSGISKELDLYLAEASGGIPYYCKELLQNLNHHGVLTFHRSDYEEKTYMTWKNLFKNFIKPTVELRRFTLSDEGEAQDICGLLSGVRLRILSLPASLKGKQVSLVQLDSMSFSDQMLVRRAAILGLTFTTEQLLEVLPGWDMKMMIKALATLVESYIFDCFRNAKELRMGLKQNAASHELHVRSQALRPSEGMAWHGEAEEAVGELQSVVAEIRIVRFCRPIMQKTAYELWLKDEKRAMHLTCTRFLEEDARRCQLCRGEDFVPYHHFVVDLRFNRLDLHNIHKMAKSHGFHTKEEAVFPSAEMPQRVKTSPETPSPEEIQEKILGFFDTVISRVKASEENAVPSEPCQCEEILEMVLLPLAHHFLALGEDDKALYYLLEAAAAYMSWGDNYKICYNVGQLFLAKKMLRKALKLLNQNFPSNLLTLFLRARVEKNRHSSFANPHPKEGSPPGEKRLAHLYQQTVCFSLLWRIYGLNYFFYYKYYGDLAAMMQVNSALETQNDFQIIKAYLDYSLYHQLRNCQGVWFKYEVMAVEKTFHLPLKAEGIQVMAYVADTLSYMKFILGCLDLAIELGSRAQKMWALLQNPSKQYSVLCRLTTALFLKNKQKQLVVLLQRLWDFSVAEDHTLSKGFFYFVCLDIMLYSGFVYRTFEECLKFIHQNEDNTDLKFHSGILLALYSCVAIWYARLEKWDDFDIFSKKAKHLMLRRTPTALYYEGVTRYLEGQVLNLQKQIEQEAENAQDYGVELLKTLERLVAQNMTCPVFYPRLYHLMAYVCVLMGEVENCNLFLSTALKLSELQGNVLEKSWLNMTKELWYSGTELALQENKWLRTALALPSWDSIVTGDVKIEDIQKNKFLIRVTILENYC
ncbi:Adenylate cyclase type 10 [Tupaia chinensis]|uniref:Adenylate cyclase type 10 n=1 Tax=Tupaia chinensis TaxID=246437 RepID=L9KXM0_TUPCH|nr:Adenylate cyclase type 10 [Tupaia chinensis]